MKTQMTLSLIQYALAAVGLISTLFLFVSVKREIHSNSARHRRRMEDLSRKLSEVPAIQTEPAFIPTAPRSGLNLSKRVQAMRMLRRNENVSHVAAVLGVTRREIELLIRVQRLSATAVNPAAN
jgi:hypothetical protein